MVLLLACLLIESRVNSFKNAHSPSSFFHRPQTFCCSAFSYSSPVTGPPFLFFNIQVISYCKQMWAFIFVRQCQELFSLARGRTLCCCQGVHAKMNVLGSLLLQKWLEALFWLKVWKQSLHIHMKI